MNEWRSIHQFSTCNKACGLRSFLPIPGSGEGEMHPPPQLQLSPGKGKNIRVTVHISIYFYALEISVRCSSIFASLVGPRTVPALGDLRHACGQIELLQQCLQRQWWYMTVWPSQALGLTSAQILAKLGWCSYCWLRIFVALSSQITSNITATGFVRSHSSMNCQDLSLSETSCSNKRIQKHPKSVSASLFQHVGLAI